MTDVSDKTAEIPEIGQSTSVSLAEKVVAFVSPQGLLICSSGLFLVMMFSGIEAPPVYWVLGIVTGLLAGLIMAGRAIKDHETTQLGKRFRNRDIQ